MNNDIVFLPVEKHEYSIILLHGMNQTNESLMKLTYKLIKKYKNLKIILPNSPKRDITWKNVNDWKNINDGLDGDVNNINSWYNYFTHNDGLMKHDEIDESEFYVQVKRINKIIDEEVNLLHGKSDNILIGGFSQGGTLALHIGLNYYKPLGCIIGVHTILMDNVTCITNECQKIPIYLFSGKKDEIYNIRLQKRSLKNLKKLEYEIVWKIEKDLTHSQYSNSENLFIIKAINNIIK